MTRLPISLTRHGGHGGDQDRLTCRDYLSSLALTPLCARQHARAVRCGQCLYSLDLTAGVFEKQPIWVRTAECSIPALRDRIGNLPTLHFQRNATTCRRGRCAQSRRHDQRGHGRCSVSAALGTSEEPRLSRQRKSSKRSAALFVRQTLPSSMKRAKSLGFGARTGCQL